MSCEEIIYMKKGDRLPSVFYWLSAPEALTTPDSVTFKFEPEAGGTVISGSATVVELSGGRVKVRYDWGASDTAAAGRFNAEFVAVFGGKDMTFPNGDGRDGGAQYLILVISEDVS